MRPDPISRFLSRTGRALQGSAIRRMGTLAAGRQDVVSFAPGYPDATLFPWDELRAIAGELLRDQVSSLQYGPTRGYAPLLEALLQVMEERGVRVSGDNLLITSGSQQGVDLVARLIVDPDDVVLLELPTFTGAIAAFGNAGATLAGVPQGEDGIDLGVLDEVWLRHERMGRRPKLLYLIPNFQNPSGVLLAQEKRGQLLEWAARRDVLIVEDDPYGSLYFEDVAREEDTRPIRAQDEEERVIYLSSFSKTLAPGFRVGWVVAPAALTDRLETAKQSVDLASGSLDQRMVHEALRQGLIDRLAPQLRGRYRFKRDVMERALRESCGDRLRWLPPRGGFFVWARLPEGLTDSDLLTRALEHQVVFVAGSAFHVDGSGHDTIRLSFSEPSPERIEEGIRRLGPLVAQAADSVR